MNRNNINTHLKSNTVYLFVQSILFIVYLFPFQIRAQKSNELESVTVTATRWPVPETRTGQQITILTSAQMAQLPGNTLEDVLKFSGLVELQQRGPAGAINDIVIRGGTFQQVLVLIDGIKMNDPVTGHFSASFPIPKWQIERIEILKGPAAAIYGSEAVGGVVHIITKAFQTHKDSTIHQHYAALSGGMYQFLGAEAGIRKSLRKTQLSFGASTDNTQGITLRSGKHGYVHRHSGMLALQTPVGKKSAFRWMTVYDYRNFAAENFYTTYVSDTARETVQTLWSHLSFKTEHNNALTEIAVAHKYTNDYYLYNPISSANENSSHAFNFQAMQHRVLHETFKLSYGVQGMVNLIRSNDRGNHQTNRGALFTSGVWTFKEFTVQPGLRFEQDENFGSEWLPQLSLNYNLQPFIIKAHYGRAIRAADYTERYNNFNKSLVSAGSIGNPDLKAERSQNFEAGMEYRKYGLTAGICYFDRKQNNIIDWVSTPYEEMPRKENLVAGNTYALARNIRSLHTRGFEFNINWQRTLPKSRWIFVQISSGFMKSTSDAEQPSFYIRSHAKQLHQQTLAYKFKNWTISLNGLYKVRDQHSATSIERSISGSYLLLNGHIHYTRNKWRIFLDAMNLTDQTYSDVLGAVMPGRWITGGVSVQW